jgi:CBS domain-containing protein
MGMTTSTKPGEGELLTIRDRRTLGDATGVAVSRTVDCPRRASSVDVHDCGHCGFGKIVWREGAPRAEVKCTHARTLGLDPRPITFDAHTLVKSVMSPHVLCVREDASLDAIATLFLEDHLTAVPVLDAEGRPMGMVSKTDLLREVRERGEIPEAPVKTKLPSGFHVDRSMATTAGDVMTPLVFAVLENATLAQAIPLMAFEGVHHAPVVTTEGRVVGVLSSMDVLRWLSQSLRSA